MIKPITFVRSSNNEDPSDSGYFASSSVGRFGTVDGLVETLDMVAEHSSEVLNTVAHGGSVVLAASRKLLGQQGPCDVHCEKHELSGSQKPVVNSPQGRPDHPGLESSRKDLHFTVPRTSDRSSSGPQGTGNGGSKCRQFKVNMTRVVKHATSTVSHLCEVAIKQPTLTGKTCISLYREVKSFLSQEVSADPSVQMAFQSIKKLLPDACPCMSGSMLLDLEMRLSRPPPVLPSGYVQHCKKVLFEIFKPGWDRSWEDKVETFSPSLGSCSESSRASGGQLASLAEAGQSDWKTRLNSHCGQLTGELLLVNSSGKPRPLTKFTSDSALLRPLHSLLYDTLSEQPWLLRGDVTSEKLRAAGFTGEGEDLVSGDYVSASDNLPIEVAELILDVAWSTSRYVPASNFSYAVSAQRPRLSYEGEDHLRRSFVPTVGQMMGSYLCFPLLCLQNYLAFRWAFKDEVVPPVLINGDDILFQKGSRYQHWVDTVSRVGLEVERSKTSVDPVFGTLNSTLLRRVKGSFVRDVSHVKVVNTLRMGLLRRPEHPGSLGESFDKFVEGNPKNRYQAGIEFLNWHSSTILQWGAVAQDMRFFGRVARKCWKTAFKGSLWKREAILRSQSLPYLEPMTSPHTIVMESNEFQRFEPSQVSGKAKKEISRWMAARKWELGKTFARVKGGRQMRRRQSEILHVLFDRDLFKNKRKLIDYVNTQSLALVKPEKQKKLFGPNGDSVQLRVRSCWLRPLPNKSVRVPVVLLPELGLETRGLSVDEVLCQVDPGLFPRGRNMLWNRAAFETVKVKLNRELQCSRDNLDTLKAREGTSTGV